MNLQNKNSEEKHSGKHEVGSNQGDLALVYSVSLLFIRLSIECCFMLCLCTYCHKIVVRNIFCVVLMHLCHALNIQVRHALDGGS